MSVIWIETFHSWNKKTKWCEHTGLEEAYEHMEKRNN